MKTIFDKDFMFNPDGLELASSFEKMFRDWMNENTVSVYNPVEVAWMIDNEIKLKLSNIYLNKVEEHMFE